MALAENHRNALKAEAASVLKHHHHVTGNAAAPAHPHQHPQHSEYNNPHHAGAERPRPQHEYSEMLNQVYTSHLTAQLQSSSQFRDEQVRKYNVNCC